MFKYTKQAQLDRLELQLAESREISLQEVNESNLETKITIKDKMNHIQDLILELKADKKSEEAQFILDEKLKRMNEEKHSAAEVIKKYVDAINEANSIMNTYKDKGFYKFKYNDYLGIAGHPDLYREFNRLTALVNKSFKSYENYLEA